MFCLHIASPNRSIPMHIYLDHVFAISDAWLRDDLFTGF